MTKIFGKKTNKKTKKQKNKKTKKQKNKKTKKQKNNSLNLARKYAQIFVRRNNIFPKIREYHSDIPQLGHIQSSDTFRPIARNMI